MAKQLESNIYNNLYFDYQRDSSGNIIMIDSLGNSYESKMKIIQSVDLIDDGKLFKFKFMREYLLCTVSIINDMIVETYYTDSIDNDSTWFLIKYVVNDFRQNDNMKSLIIEPNDFSLDEVNWNDFIFNRVSICIDNPFIIGHREKRFSEGYTGVNRYPVGTSGELVVREGILSTGATPTIKPE